MEGQVGGHEYVSELMAASQVESTKVATRHFDWTHPSVPIEGENDESVDGDRPTEPRWTRLERSISTTSSR